MISCVLCAVARISSAVPVDPVSVQLGVPTDVNDTDLKKAYRKAAMKVRGYDVWYDVVYSCVVVPS